MGLEDDFLIPYDKIFTVDDRNKHFIADFESHYKQIEGIKLDGRVDSDVRVHFATALNLFLYSWFVYRFTMPAMKQALASCEFALRRTAQRHNYNNIRGFRKLLQKAHTENWIDLKLLNPGIEPERQLEILVHFRNDLSHGNHTLFMPWQVKEFIQDCANIINMLWVQK